MLHHVGTSRQAGRALLALLLMIILTGVALPAASLAQTIENYGPWRGEYFDNQGVSGAPKLVRTDNHIDFDWNLASPDPSIPNEHFSARWTAFIEFAGGTYRFQTITDDGVRVWIDENLVMDRWQVQPAVDPQFNVSLAAGRHYIRVEYFDNTDRAVAKFFWQRLDAAPPPPGNWQAEYYNNRWLSGSPIATRGETDINLDWGYGSPIGCPADDFSARWTRTLHFNAGSYTFYARADDGIRVWLDSQLILDRWVDQSATNTASATINVSAGNHYVRIEYYEHLGVASARVWWQPAGAPPPPTPTACPVVPPATVSEVVVDNLSSGFRKSGSDSGWRSASIGYGGHTYWTYNSVYQVANYASWTPSLLGAGNYQVYAYIPSNYADTRAARYRVFHNGQRDDAVIGQHLYFNKWVLLGTFYFHAGGGEYVYLADNTGEAYASKRLGFDAIRFVRVGGAPAPAPTPTPVPQPLPACAIMPQAGFGRIWTQNATVRTRLGCPLEPEKTISAAEESFQNGLLFWRSDGKIIYALYASGTWQNFMDRWQEGDPVSDASIAPPWGFYQPVRGFGKAWREEPGVRGRLGWATETERGFNAAVQPFEHGLMIWSNAKGTYVLYNDGTWQRFD